MQALQEGHVVIPGGGVRISGRDITLAAPRGQALISDATREMVATIRGVRSVAVKELPPAPSAVQ